jgi:hypothetical protein
MSTALTDLKRLSIGKAALVLAYRGFAVLPLGLKKRPLANCRIRKCPRHAPGRDTRKLLSSYLPQILRRHYRAMRYR